MAKRFKIRIVMAQLNMLVGGIFANVNKVVDAAEEARDELCADVIVFPELTLTGYPPEDLLMRPDLYDRVSRALQTIEQKVRGINCIIGYPRKVTTPVHPFAPDHPAQSDDPVLPNDSVQPGAHGICASMHVMDGVYNVAAWVCDGKIEAIYHKQHPPNYGVFDEKRYFLSGAEQACVVDVKGLPIGITICEDIWVPGPARQCAQAGARLIININASPFHVNKRLEREHVIRRCIAETAVPVMYVNLIGGQDELVFDGESFVMDAQGTVVQRAPAFKQGLYPVDFEIEDQRIRSIVGDCPKPLSTEESIYRALVLGTRDYVNKNGFRGVVIGLSGGIDSALTLALAVDALGSERVEAVMMPSRYTADMSVEDARQEAEALGVEYRVISIESMFGAFRAGLRDEFAGLGIDTTEENLQARCRGVLLMAISNKKRKMVLTTGNKSEMAVGYATLYGDMAGGFDVLKDVPKTMVYKLAELRNRISPDIPQRVLDRPPTAELAPDQKDQDLLPPYPLLDDILERYVEQDQSIKEIVASGKGDDTVKKVVDMIDRNEYKRRQAAPGIRITQRAFGRDRRYPITSGYNKEHGM